MAPTIQSFAKKLTDSGLMTAAEVTGLTQTIEADSAKTFVETLVKQKRLTAYQANALWHGTEDPLVIGNYTILSQLGKGGMGQVYRARHRTMKRQVALKILPSANPQTISRFHREIEASAKLIHPNIVTAYDAGEDNGIHFLTMECIEGNDLGKVVKSREVTITQALEWIKQAAIGLQYAHERGVIHRDIKPNNLLLTNDGQVKVLDMGLARITDNDFNAQTQAELTTDGTVMGTVAFMSPEQALGKKSIDARSDIYSLGCTLYYLIAGKNVFEGTNHVSICLSHQTEAPPELINELENKIFQKMVAKNPDDRYQSMNELIKDIDTALIEDDPFSATATFSSINAYIPASTACAVKVAPKKKNHWKIFAFSGLSVSILLIFSLIKLVPSQSQTPTQQDSSQALQQVPTQAQAPVQASVPTQKVSHRELIERLLDLKGSVVVMSNNKEISIKHKSELPVDFDVLEIKLVDAQVTDKDLNGVSKLENLHSLYLANTKITDAILSDIGSCKSLSRIGLGSCKITEVGLKHLSNLKMEYLHLGRVNLNQKCVDVIMTFNRVDNITVNDTGLSDDDIKRLRSKHGVTQ